MNLNLGTDERQKVAVIRYKQALYRIRNQFVNTEELGKSLFTRVNVLVCFLNKKKYPYCNYYFFF